MDALIKFRMLFDSLSGTEQQSFVNNLIQSCGMDLIKNALFSHFAEKIISHKSYNQNHLESINQIVSKIIHERIPNTTEDEDEDIDLSIATVLDDLSPPLLSNIGSFLPSNEYNNFQISNRRVYIGANSPFSLQKLFLMAKKEDYWLSHFKSLSANRLRQLQSLRVQMERFNELINPICNYSHFSNLRQLHLTQCNSDELLLAFLKQNCINLQNIESLLLYDVGKEVYGIGDDTQIDGKLFLKFLSKFINLKQLDHIGHFVISDGWNDEGIPYFPQLKAISVDETDDLMTALIDKHYKQIESFESEAGLGTHDLPNLKELVNTLNTGLSFPSDKVGDGVITTFDKSAGKGLFDEIIERTTTFGIY